MGWKNVNVRVQREREREIVCVHVLQGQVKITDPASLHDQRLAIKFPVVPGNIKSYFTDDKRSSQQWAQWTKLEDC
jgi:hypothetical protein